MKNEKHRFWKTHLKNAFLTGTAVAIIFCIISALLIASELDARVEQADHIDYAIILGSGLNQDQISQRLKARLDAGYAVLAQNNIPVIVSGGQGPDEWISEAAAMKKYLVEKGLDENRIMMEDQSTSTYENLKFSKAIIGQEGVNLLIITSDTHLYRAKMLGKRMGFRVTGVSAVNGRAERLKLAAREIFALIKDLFLYRN